MINKMIGALNAKLTNPDKNRAIHDLKNRFQREYFHTIRMHIEVTTAIKKTRAYEIGLAAGRKDI